MEAFLFWDGNSSVGEEVPEKTLLFHVRREMAQSQNCAIRLDMNVSKTFNFAGRGPI
jgi:hypothetical protein